MQSWGCVCVCVCIFFLQRHLYDLKATGNLSPRFGMVVVSSAAFPSLSPSPHTPHTTHIEEPAQLVTAEQHPPPAQDVVPPLCVRVSFVFSVCFFSKVRYLFVIDHHEGKPYVHRRMCMCVCVGVQIHRRTYIHIYICIHVHMRAGEHERRALTGRTDTEINKSTEWERRTIRRRGPEKRKSNE